MLTNQLQHRLNTLLSKYINKQINMFLDSYKYFNLSFTFRPRTKIGFTFLLYVHEAAFMKNL